MSNPLLEMCVESVEFAVAAQRGGARRIELCSQLSGGGLFPGVERIRAVREHVSIPIYVMVRPRLGNFCYTDEEFAVMQKQILQAKELGCDGVVLGLLDFRREVDFIRTLRLVELAQPLPVTFHRAFDESADSQQALEEVIKTGAKRILTSGGPGDAESGLSTICGLVAQAAERIIVMPGGGVNERNAARVLARTSASEIHSALGGLELSAESMHDGTIELFEERVRKLAATLNTRDALPR